MPLMHFRAPSAIRVFSVLVLLGSLLGSGQGFAAHRPDATQEARALELLQKMAEAYKNLPLLDQRTEFFSALIPLVKPESAPEAASKTKPDESGEPMPEANRETRPDDTVKKLEQWIRLQVARPNRLRLTRFEPEPGKQTGFLSEWVSDGRNFWTYNQERNWFTSEKAPGRLSDFSRLASLNNGSLELLMLMGVNPFARIKGEAETLEVRPAETVRGVLTEVVLLKSANPYEETEVRFYIGKEDFLLRRMVVESTPIRQTTGSRKVGDPLDELVEEQERSNPAPQDPNAPEDLPAARPSLPMKRRIGYDNILVPRPDFDELTFAFKIPMGALLREPVDSTGSRSKASRDDQIASVFKSMGLKPPKLKKVRR